jgi:hypothetical protein
VRPALFSLEPIPPSRGGSTAPELLAQQRRVARTPRTPGASIRTASASCTCSAPSARSGSRQLALASVFVANPGQDQYLPPLPQAVSSSGRPTTITATKSALSHGNRSCIPPPFAGRAYGLRPSDGFAGLGDGLRVPISGRGARAHVLPGVREQELGQEGHKSLANRASLLTRGRDALLPSGERVCPASKSPTGY